jgi:predicted deacylase
MALEILNRSIVASDESPTKDATRIWTDIDLDKEGQQLGYFRLNHSVHEHGSTWVPIPVAIFKNGLGPRILLLGGVHGDEYEGQVMLMKLMRELSIENVCGQLIVMSAANAPAAYAGKRTSPLDGGNLNRAYPGNSKGTPTERIAHFIETVLMPRVEYLLDFHSGGLSERIMPSAHVYYSDNPEKQKKLMKLLRDFGMPTSVVLKGLMDHDTKAAGACDRNGILRFSSELGGGGGIRSVTVLRRAEQGLRRLLFSLGAIRQPMTDEPAPETNTMARLPTRTYVYAMASGIFEPFVEIGDSVQAGQAAGAVHFPEEPWRAPWVGRFSESGVVYGMRSLARTQLGDALYMLAVPWKE